MTTVMQVSCYESIPLTIMGMAAYLQDIQHNHVHLMKSTYIILRVRYDGYMYVRLDTIVCALPACVLDFSFLL